MSCPQCGCYGYQYIIGYLGNRSVLRCGCCGWQYEGERVQIAANLEPVRSESEWGSFCYDGEADMKVLRKRAEGAVRFFNNGRPKVEMMTNIFGYPFSIIDRGRLVDTDNAHGGNNIIRCLAYKETGFYGGNVTLSYNDEYNDGRGQGGSGSVMIGNVTDVHIDGDYLVISGNDGPRQRTFRYLIQERPDDKSFVRPLPKKEAPRQEPKRPEPPKRDEPKPVPAAKRPAKPEPPKKGAKKTEPPSRKPIPKAQPRKPTVARVSKGDLVYEVRVNGTVKGSFSSKSKAESLKKELKACGTKAQVVGVFV